jgi:hypothetical protein
MPRYDDDSDLDPPPRRRRRPTRKKSGNGPVLILVCLGIALLVVVGTGVVGYLMVRGKSGAGLGLAGGPPKGDLEQLAGSWECTFRDPAGNVVMHKVKQIAGTTETATWYRPDGSVFRVNRVEFELTTRGQSKVFRYFNGWVVDGPGAGQPFPSGEYVYTLEGDTWTEYDAGGPIVWTRRR